MPRPRPDRVFVLVLELGSPGTQIDVYPSELDAKCAVADYVTTQLKRQGVSLDPLQRLDSDFIQQYFPGQSYVIHERTVEYGEIETEIEKPLIITELRCVCGACPLAYEGKTDDGREVYIRYRWGTVRLDLDGETLVRRQVGDELDGTMSYARL